VLVTTDRIAPDRANAADLRSEPKPDRTPVTDLAVEPAVNPRAVAAVQVLGERPAAGPPASLSLSVGRFRSSLPKAGSLIPAIVGCIPLHTCRGNVVCATLVRDRNPPFAPPAVVVIIAAPGLTPGGKGLPVVEVTIRSRVFTGMFTDMQAVVIADYPALAPLSPKLITASKGACAPNPLRLRGVLTSGPGTRLRLGSRCAHENPSFEFPGMVLTPIL